MTGTRIAVLAVLSVSALIVACGTSKRQMSIGSDCDPNFCDGPEPAGFESADASADVATDAPAPMCPSTECSGSFRTCSTSLLPCDVDTATDRENCGACGVRCPTSTYMEFGMQMRSRCESGACVAECKPGFGDCDGVPDNGCETGLGSSPEHCGACGNKCPPGEPCIGGKCGCVPPTVSCGGRCVDLSSFDTDCGACDLACDPEPPGWSSRPNTYNGCVAKACQRKCRSPFADCNGLVDDGCEVDLSTPDDANCGGCGIACQPGTKCRFDVLVDGLRCTCPPPTTDCSSNPDVTRCVDLSSDTFNCGACGRVCPSSPGTPGVCTNGLCELLCPPNTADCNGLLDDGCEKNLRSDPRNCGACGNACDGAPGQPCVDGQCSVEECGGPR